MVQGSGFSKWLSQVLVDLIGFGQVGSLIPLA